jgi:hypothetical protein
VRQRFFSPRLKFKSYTELNAYLLDRCVAHAPATARPEQKDKTVFDLFEAERAAPQSIPSCAGPHRPTPPALRPLELPSLKPRGRAGSENFGGAWLLWIIGFWVHKWLSH